MTPILQWQNISVTLDNRTLFSSFSGALLLGEKVHIFGPSGCGKSTFLKIIMGFFHDFTGEISVSGAPLTAHTIWQIRREVAWLPQEADIGGFPTAGDFVWATFSYAHNKKLQSAIYPWLDALQLPRSILEKRPEVLSGGEKQRLALASVLALNRRLVLLDEPLSALDPLSTAVVSNVLSGLADTAVVVVSHIPIQGDCFMSMEMGASI